MPDDCDGKWNKARGQKESHLHGNWIFKKDLTEGAEVLRVAVHEPSRQTIRLDGRAEGWYSHACIRSYGTCVHTVIWHMRAYMIARAGSPLGISTSPPESY